MKTGTNPGLLYGMPLTGTACALRDFAHAQNHPSDRRPHANVNTSQQLPASTATISTVCLHGLCRHCEWGNLSTSF
ncbi:hypothetical protein B9M98_28085 [Escherichia coli]|nr:hypothetical protein [Salmonella enterica subsp. enterica serovar Virchow]MBY1060210.1 hypothetical protein [Citrobacter europaeus]RBV91848.1 hypothetical protein B9M98_28085 [Escherichia coli]HAU5643140.1 hypothetical protein [Citrobacter freundii]